MLTTLPDLPAHVVGYRIDGTVTESDIASVYRTLDAAARGGDRLHLYAEITGIGGMTLDALAANVRRGFRSLGVLRQIGRYAVVSDVGWIRSVAQLQGAALPGLAVRAWPEAGAAEALAWASEPVASA